MALPSYSYSDMHANFSFATNLTRVEVIEVCFWGGWGGWGEVRWVCVEGAWWGHPHPHAG